MSELSTLSELLKYIEEDKFIIKYVISNGIKIEFNKNIKEIDEINNIHISLIYIHETELKCYIEVDFKDLLVHKIGSPAYNFYSDEYKNKQYFIDGNLYDEKEYLEIPEVKRFNLSEKLNML